MEKWLISLDSVLFVDDLERCSPVISVDGLYVNDAMSIIIPSALNANI